MTEELIHDRIGFRKFLDIKDDDTIPDETTICKFRLALIEQELLGDIFDEVKKVMEKKRLILNEGTLIDATLIHTSEPKKKKDEKVILYQMKLMIKMQVMYPKEVINIMA